MAYLGAAEDILHDLGEAFLKGKEAQKMNFRTLVPVKNVRKAGNKDMIHDDWLPMAQRYFLF